MEGTWRAYKPQEDEWVTSDTVGQFDFSVGPLRRRLSQDEKKSYTLLDSQIQKGVLQQLYVFRGNATAGEIDEVVELVWRP
jgi:hypothetical protein